MLIQVNFSARGYHAAVLWILEAPSDPEGSSRYKRHFRAIAVLLKNIIYC